MDDGSDSNSIWQRLARVFHGRHTDTVEQAIRDASEDGELDKEEGSMLLSVLTLDELQVQDIMTPRTDMACSADDDSIRQVAELMVASGHSRIPVFSDNRDNIIGITYTKDLLRHLLDAAGQALPVTAIMREPFFVPETKNVLDLLQEFRSRKLHLAVVLDEYGGTAGLVTIEDVLEQIVGDIEDEHDAPREQEISAQADGSYLIAGRADLEDLTEALPVSVCSEEVDTLGGYLTHLAGRVPKAGEDFRIDGHVFRVVSSDAKQIHRVRMLPPGAAGKDVLTRPDVPQDGAAGPDAPEESAAGPDAPQDGAARPERENASPPAEKNGPATSPLLSQAVFVPMAGPGGAAPEQFARDPFQERNAPPDQERQAEEASGAMQGRNATPGA